MGEFESIFKSICSDSFTGFSAMIYTGVLHSSSFWNLFYQRINGQ